MCIDKINELYAGQIFSRETQIIARDRIHWICRQVQGEKILDIGSSQGIVCLLLGREGFDCIGVDSNKEAVDYALNELGKEQETTRKRVKFQLADATHLSFENDSFDTVILGEILEHLTHPEKVIKEAKRVIKEKGRIIITVPFGLNPDPDHKRVYYPLSFLQSIQPFFKTRSIDTHYNYIVYCGEKDSSYNFSDTEKEALLTEYTRLQKKVEERCLEKEQFIFEKTSHFNNQIKKLNDQIVSLSKTNMDMKEVKVRELEAKEKEFKEILLRKEKEWGRKLTARDEELKIWLDAVKVEKNTALSYQEKMFTHAWKWRIGSVFVEGYILVRDLIKHPVGFAKEAGRRFKDYYHAVNPGKLSEISGIKEEKKKDISGNLPVIGSRPKSTDALPVKKKTIPSKENKTAFGCILDEFTAACFDPECRLITFRPDNWKEVLEADPPHAIFVESAWRGNEGSWQYKIAKYGRNMGDELIQLLAWAKENNIPSIFWNKEDPSHFDRFIDKAKLFDYVFTTDSDCIARYLEEAGHNRIFALPFAAHPKIHNPVLKHPREYNVCFAGTYYGASHPERRQDMEIILKPSLDFGLHIYDRQYGMTGPDAAQFRFPDIYRPAIMGRLDYHDMLKAYKNYKVFVNVNSIKTSPTMFSRRVFELLACGTPVISTYSRGIVELLGDDCVLITESETDTKNYLEKLMNDDDYWSKLSVKGMRKVMEEHTYNRRVKYICDCTGLNHGASDLPSFTIISKVDNPQALSDLKSSLARQTYRNFDVVLLLEQDSTMNDLQKLHNALPDNKIKCILTRSKKDYIDLLHSTLGEFIVLFNCNDHYGPDYLKDHALAVIYAQPDYLGKSTHFIGVSDKVNLKSRGNEFRFVSRVPASSLVIRKKVLDPRHIQKILTDDEFQISDNKILSLDRFNYIKSESGKILPDLAKPVDI